MTVVVAHGAGSSGAAVRGLFGQSLGPLGQWRTIEDRSADIESLAARVGFWAARAELLVGVSLGAHAIAGWAAAHRNTGPALLLVLPAWTGPPDAVAGATLASARGVRARGIPTPMDMLTDREDYADPDSRELVEIIASGAAAYSPASLSRALAHAATQPGPTLEDLGRILAPSIVVGWPNDPLHPYDVACAWAAAIPGGTAICAERRTPQALRRAVAEARSQLRATAVR